MRYYIIAGEASGDMHGANLIAQLKKSDTTAEFRFWGGEKMESEAGVKPVKHYKETAIMGFTAVLLNLRKIQGFFKLCKKDITEWKPDCILFIDYPGFNLKMAKWAKERNYKTFYYIAPKVWAWKEGRVKALKAYIDKLFVIFPFEIEWFKERGIEVSYVGNPLLDEITERQLAIDNGQLTMDSSAEKNVIQNSKIVALVAGSRKMEVEHNLPVMAEVMARFPDYDGVVTGVEWLDKSIYEKALRGATNVRVVYGKTYETLEKATAALVTSGTATLETALLNVPQVVCYRGPSVSMAIARMVVGGRIKWISLVNIVMNRTVVTELVGNRVFVTDIAEKELKNILPGGSDNKKITEDYKELKELLGQTGASKRCAEQIVEILRK